ncbi:MAG: ParB/RepB/Spo0J family partition protein [Sediminibacterium sp.]|uniref:ParB/RepB/Spo0J family partition protein n=1 Tax=Sediminibacterium sp. TaxID=1917865 RepID=UPI002724D41C|nr:ParB/RepB/Spo0J family partition protein [Sediminibacterium sp.]MDO8997230.1 ParB/RepB/Spo0J family partition protein [Sediminibacterium sp.]
MQETNFKLIPLSDLVTSPTNPRKSFDQSKTTELAESIKEKGVLQPILVRAKGKKFEIICGERRFRASQMVKAVNKQKDTIPAIIREMDDQEVRELQLIENFQREDVHPMEEALAIKYAIETGQYSTEELCAKVGKSEYYIKQRIKLNNLSDKLQQLFFHGNLNISTAIKFSVYSHEIQDEIIEDDFDFEDLMKDPSEKVELQKWTEQKYTGKLSEATFDINDKELLKDMGSCVNCRFNTGVALLFPEDANTARCTNIACYKLKTETTFLVELEKAKQDPACVFVSTNWGDKFDNPKFCNGLISDGHDVYTKYSYEELEKPTLESWEEYKDDRDWNTADEDDRADIEEDFQKDREDYLDDLAKYNDSVESGKYIKALIVDGNQKGEYIYITISGKKSSSQASSAKVDTKAADVTVADIDSEIARIKEKSKRNKEIDENKIWDELKKHFAPGSNSSVLKGYFSAIERKAIAQSIYEKLDFNYRDTFRKQYNWKDNKNQFPEVDEQTLRQMTRFFFLAVLPPTTLFNGFSNSPNALLSIELAKEYFSDLLNEAINTQKAKAEKRENKVAQTIAELQAKKKELAPKKAKAVKK